MQWGEAQSVIQLAAALNALYLSFREIRSRSIDREEQACLKHQQRLAQITELKLKQDINDHRHDMNIVVAAFLKTDRRIGIACVCSLVFYTLLVVLSAYLYDQKFNDTWQKVTQSQFNYATDVIMVFFVVTGFGPVFVGLFLNLKLVGALDGRILKTRVGLDGRVVAHLQGKPAVAAKIVDGSKACPPIVEEPSNPLEPLAQKPT